MQQLTENAKRLRKTMTKEERKLWYEFLRGLSCTVNRQKVIGAYIVDFFCASAKIVIELDGSQHYEAEASEKDARRDAYFKKVGIKVLRYTNLDISQNFQGVCEDILREIAERAPSHLLKR